MTPDRTARIEKWYRRIGTVTIGAVLFLILVGGIVRSTGSGMGCPDWPKCFGLMVPPTSVEQIPTAFFEQHPEYQTQSFNVAQTWTEYINRLIGALIGLLVFLTTVLSFIYLKRDRRVFILSAGALLLTGFQGWLGKLVVDKNLSGGMVTIHMFVALVILMILILAVYFAYSDKKSFQPSPRFSSGMNLLGWGVVIITMVQILIGTQVRETVDEVAILLGEGAKGEWIEELGIYYSIHRVFWAIVTVAIVVWVKKLLQESNGNRFVRAMVGVMIAGLAMEILLGISLAAFALPPWMQPLHLLIASLIFAAQFSLLIYCAKLERIAQPKVRLGGIKAPQMES